MPTCAGISDDFFYAKRILNHLIFFLYTGTQKNIAEKKKDFATAMTCFHVFNISLTHYKFTTSRGKNHLFINYYKDQFANVTRKLL